MKSLVLAGAFAAAVIPFQSATAQEDLTFGVKAGLLTIENDSDSAVNVGGIVSFAFPNSPGGIEGEVNTSVVDGSFNRFVDYSVTQFGAFGTFTIPPQEDINVKFRAGVVYTSLDPSTGSTDDDTNLAFGVGGNAGHFELSWTHTQFKDADVDFLALGYNF